MSMYLDSATKHVTNSSLDFNWNYEKNDASEVPQEIPARPTTQQLLTTDIQSECLRDGLQGALTYPDLEMQCHYIDMLSQFGVRYATVGIFPGRTEHLSFTMKKLLEHIRAAAPQITPYLLCLCTDDSLRWVAECKEIHPAVEAVVFMGSAPSRRLVQGWSINLIVDRVATSIQRLVTHGIDVVAATEHTTQTSPHDVRAIFEAQVQAGAHGIGIADTIGIARPQGAYRIVKYVRSVLDSMGAQDMLIDWHGHRDLGNALGNALAAVAAGANRIDVVARGVGERSGNTPLEEFVLNVAEMLDEDGLKPRWDLSKLLELINFYARMVGIDAPQHGVLGQRYSHTSSGIHTDAMLKAEKMADRAHIEGDFKFEARLRKMARSIYSSVDPYSVGGSPSIGVGPWSGKSAVKLALRAHAGADELTPVIVDGILDEAGDRGRELTADELLLCYARLKREAQSNHDAG